MTGLDTNVLARLLVNDDPAQTSVAKRAVSGLTKEEPGYISLVVLVELAWVLDRSYGIPAKEVAAAVDGLLRTDIFMVQNPYQVFVSIAAAKSGACALADVLIAGLNQWAGCKTTLTFDIKASRLPGFTLI